MPDQASIVTTIKFEVMNTNCKVLVALDTPLLNYFLCVNYLFQSHAVSVACCDRVATCKPPMPGADRRRGSGTLRTSTRTRQQDKAEETVSQLPPAHGYTTFAHAQYCLPDMPLCMSFLSVLQKTRRVSSPSSASFNAEQPRRTNSQVCKRRLDP